MTPTKPLHLYTIRGTKPGEPNRKITFLSSDKIAAYQRYEKYHDEQDREGWSFQVTMPTCNDRPMTEVHCLKYGTKFQTVHRGGVSQDFDNDKYYVKSPVFTKYDYNPINRTYLCTDREGNKHYVDAYEWCIVTEEEK